MKVGDNSGIFFFDDSFVETKIIIFSVFPFPNLLQEASTVPFSTPPLQHPNSNPLPFLLSLSILSSPLRTNPHTLPFLLTNETDNFKPVLLEDSLTGDVVLERCGNDALDAHVWESEGVEESADGEGHDGTVVVGRVEVVWSGSEESGGGSGGVVAVVDMGGGVDDGASGGVEGNEGESEEGSERTAAHAAARRNAEGKEVEGTSGGETQNDQTHLRMTKRFPRPQPP